MKRFKKAVALILTLAALFTLTVSANALDGTLINSDSKSTSFGTIQGEVWCYTYPYNGRLWMQPRAVTTVNSRYTMAEVTAEIECRYNDTGELVQPTASGSDYARNTNTVTTGAEFSVPRGGKIVAFSAHGATYTTSDVLYMSTSL